MGDFALFLNNLSVQKTRSVGLLFEKLNITDKAINKKLLLLQVIKKLHVNNIDLIRWSMERMSSETATRCVRYALA